MFICFVFLKGIVPSGVTEEVIDLFVPENKVNLALSDADTLPSVNITKVRTDSSLYIRPLRCAGPV